VGILGNNRTMSGSRRNGIAEADHMRLQFLLREVSGNLHPKSANVTRERSVNAPCSIDFIGSWVR
jgi:hypothetical protein